MAYTAAEKGEDPGNEVAKLRSPRSPDNSPDWLKLDLYPAVSPVCVMIDGKLSEFASH